MKINPLMFAGVMWLFVIGTAIAAEPVISDATWECLDCHATIHPGIVEGWRQSRHAEISPEQAMAIEGLSRKVSSPKVPGHLTRTVVGCAECHTLRPDAHADTFDHNGRDVHVVVSPQDCATCHGQEAEQFSKNLMAHAYGNLADNTLYDQLVESIIGSAHRGDRRVTFKPANEKTRADACFYCHGTRLKVVGKEIRDTELAGELEFPQIAGWPNQGVGRVNLDGSLGSCSACHSRHTFSIEMARKPYTCKECHVGPDVPAYKVYAASKHGNIYSSLNGSWNFSPVPWTIGKDFTAPTCAACHISLLVNADNEVIVERTHQMTNRLPWRIFGLIYAHPQPKSPDTTPIRNASGLPLPTDYSGRVAASFLIDQTEMNQRTINMQKTCLTCHDASWVSGFWQRFENSIHETNQQTRIATAIMEDIWEKGLAAGTKQKSNPFDEAPEKQWASAWLFYANSIRFASAMAGGGDYGSFAGGRYQLSQSIAELNDWLNLHSKF